MKNIRVVVLTSRKQRKVAVLASLHPVKSSNHDKNKQASSFMYRKAILKIFLSKSDEKYQSCRANQPEIAKIRCFGPPNHLKSPNHDKNEQASSFMYRKAILKILSKSDEKWQSCCVNEPNNKIHCFAALKPPKNHPTMTKMHRLHLLCTEKLS